MYRKVPSNCVTGEPSGREHADLPTTAAGGEGQSCDSHVTCGTAVIDCIAVGMRDHVIVI